MILANGKLRLLALAGLAAVALMLAAVACGGGDDDGGDGGDDGGDDGGGAQTTFDMNMHEEGGNVFELGTEKNPTLTVPAGEDITINLANQGIAIHNMRFAGEDNTYDNDDDAASEPALINGGANGVLTFTAPSDSGTYDYRCDFHPTDMKGQIVVE